MRRCGGCLSHNELLCLHVGILSAMTQTSVIGMESEGIYYYSVGMVGILHTSKAFGFKSFLNVSHFYIFYTNPLWFLPSDFLF